MKKTYIIYLIINFFLLAESKGQRLVVYDYNDLLIALDSVHSVTYDEQTVWNARRMLMTKLLRDSSLISLDTSIANFYNAHLTDNIGMLSNIRLAMDTLNTIDSSTVEEIQNNEALIEGRVTDIALYDSLLVNDTTLNGAAIAEIHIIIKDDNNYIRTFTAANDSIYSMIQFAVNVKAATIKSRNNELSSIKIYEQNEIDVNNIYLSTLAIMKADSVINYATTLFNMAKQCPLAGGPAVYYARSLYDLVNDTIIYDDDQICGSSSDTCLVPPSPGIISGRSSGICGHEFSYSIDTMAKVSGYTWTLDGYASIDSGQGSTRIWVSYSDTFTTGTISVYATDSCGSGSSSSLAISGFLKAPASINGSGTVCAYATGVPFSIDSIENATSYIWHVPSGCSIDSGQGSTRIYVDWDSMPGNVTVIASNACGSDSTILTVGIAECRLASKNIAVAASLSSDDVKLFPNPTNGDVTVIYHLNSNNAVLQLFDVVGKVVGEFKLDGMKNKFNFDASYLCCGIFEYRVVDNSNVKGRGKLVILK